MMRRFTFAAVALAIGLALPGAAADEPKVAAADVRADFQDLYGRLRASHFNLYVRRSQGEYDALHRSMLASFDRPMTLRDVRVQFQKFMAFGRIAHSRVDFPSDAYGAYRDAGGKTFPLSVRVTGGRVTVAENNSGSRAILVGHEILALNGAPMPQWLDRLGEHVSADSPYMLHTLLENRLPALLWLELGAVDSFSLQLRGANGAFDAVVPARTREEMKANAQPSQTLALDWDRRDFKILDNGVGYMRPGPFYNNILVNRHSYSNTVLVAALAQDYKFATILGEETSDLASTYGAMEQFTLPRTKIDVGFPKAHIIRPNGDTSARGVVPDIAIATPVVENKDDPVLRRAAEIAAGRR